MAGGGSGLIGLPSQWRSRELLLPKSPCGASRSCSNRVQALARWVHFFSSEVDVSISLIARLSVA